MFSLVKWRAFKCTGSKVVVPVGLEAQMGAVCKFFEHQGQSFYLTGDQGIFPVINFMELRDIDLTKGIMEKNRNVP